MKNTKTNNMNTITLKLYPETEALWKKLKEESEAGTNGKDATADQFVSSLLEAIQNPRKVADPALSARISELEGLLEQKEKAVQELAVDNAELVVINNGLQTTNTAAVEIGRTLRPYLLVCQRDNYAKDLPGLVKFMLSTLQAGKAFILDAADHTYIKTKSDE